MTIAHVILFVSSASRESIPCIQFVQQHQFPVRIVRLDTQRERHRAANGDLFQITAVPTLLLIHEDENVQLYAGRPKILEWFNQLLAPEPSVEPPRVKSTPIPYPEDEYQEPKPRKRKSKKSKSKSKKGEPRIKGLYGNKKKKSPPIEFMSSESEDSEDENPIEYVEPPPQGSRGSQRRSRGPSRGPSRPKPPTSGLMVGAMAPKGPSKTSSVQELAKEMERQMHATRGWKEEDLPVSS